MNSFRAGLALIGLLLIGANLRASITTVGPVLGPLQDDLGLTAAGASALISVPLLGFAVVSPFAPALGRRLGLEATLSASLLTLAIAIVLRSLPLPGAIWIGTVLLGAAIAVINVELPALVKRDYPDRVGQITGSYSAVQSAFAAIAAGVAVPVAGASDWGWRLSLGVWAGLAVIALAVFLPQLLSAGRRRGAAGGPDEQEVVTVTSDTGTIRTVTRDRQQVDLWRSAIAWQVTAFMGLQSVGFYIVITWMPTIEQQNGISAAAAGAHQFVLNFCALFGTLVSSALIHRLRDQRWISGLGPVGFAIGVIGHLLLPAGAGVWDGLMGFTGGVCIVVALSFFGLRTDHHADAARLSGMAQTIGYLLAAAAPIAFSALHDVVGSWRPSLIVLLCLQAVLAVVGYNAGRDRVIR